MGTELLAHMDPHNILHVGVTQWDDLPANGGPSSFDEPFATEIFNTYFWPIMCHTNMRRFLNPNSSTSTSSISEAVRAVDSVDSQSSTLG